MKRWPSGVPVFRDGCPGMYDYLTGTNVDASVIATKRFAGTVGREVFWDPDQSAEVYVGVDLERLKPLNADARAMPAIAKQGRK